jgi:hypothetical protein
MYILWEALWRRMFGSSGWDLPILKYRAIEHVLNVIATLTVLYFTGLHWILVLAATGIFEGCYWSWGHGPGFDIGNGSTDKEMIERYKERFWNKWCEKLFPESLWYSKAYDVAWMLFRYEIPAIAVAALTLNPWFALAGFTTTAIYTLCWKLHNLGKLESPTDVAEWFVGGVTGLLLLL